MKTTIKIAAVTAFLLLSILGCRNNPAAQNEKTSRVLAKINNYGLTLDDFKSEAKLILGSKALSPDWQKAKEELLGEIINKKILLQEAQKENFDKDRAFMKEIERYWEQALLKLLLEKKSAGLSRTLTAAPEEIEKEYSRMKKKIFAEITVLNNENAAVVLSRAQEKFEQIKAEFRGSIISSLPAQWWSCGDLPQGLEDTLYSLKPGEISSAFKYNGNWAVIRQIKETELEVGPLETLRGQIKKSILERKKQLAMEEWLAGLKQSADISIDKEALGQVKLQED